MKSSRFFIIIYPSSFSYGCEVDGMPWTGLCDVNIVFEDGVEFVVTEETKTKLTADFTQDQMSGQTLR